MKAIKLYKIKWNLDDVNPEERTKVLETLPEFKGFVAQDDFNVVDKVPALMKKNFGHEIITFSYNEIPIIETLDELLKYFAPSNEKSKKLWTRTGELTPFGEERFEDLRNAIKRRIRLEEEGTKEEEMPKLLDTVMLSLEKITGMDWEEYEPSTFLNVITDMVERRRKTSKKEETKEDVDIDDDRDDDEEE